MQRLGWSSVQPPEELGAVVHGPVALGRRAGGGVAIGLRCVFAHREGLHLPLLVLASGVHATAAQRQAGHGDAPPAGGPPGFSWLEVRVEVNGRAGQVHPFSQTSSSNEEHYTQESEYWIGELLSSTEPRKFP